MTVFRFRQFQVRQDRSAMKICTDATLFGAMAPVGQNARVLDIGAGTGLLSLMAAQLGAARVTGVELTEQACLEARDNFQASPWAGCLTALHLDIRDFARTASRGFDLIVSNPPFYQGHSRSVSTLRSIARHADQLPFRDLILAAAALLENDGLFYALIPVQSVTEFSGLAGKSGLRLCSRVDYRGYSHTRPNVAALVFCRNPPGLLHRELTIYRSPRNYSKDAACYLAPFLLRFAP